MSKSVNLMGYRLTESKCLIMCLLLTFVMGCFLASLPFPTEMEAFPKPPRHQITSNAANKKRLALIVPFRDRFVELLEFVPHMFHFLNKQNIPFHIFIIQQTDNNRFNRASLINVGYLYTRRDYDYIAMHDVDLLPLNANLKYEYPEIGPLHISTPKIHPKYHYNTFIGGILLVNNKHFELVNGMSNNYWGWGLEDDEFYVRLKDVGLKVMQPSNISTGPKDSFRHVHDKSYRRRDMRKCYNQREITRRRDRITGLHDVKYQVTNKHNVVIDSYPVTVVNVELICDKEKTPWCVCPEPAKTKKAKR